MESFRLIDFSILGFGGFFCLIWAVGLSLQQKSKHRWIAVYFVSVSGIRLLWEAFALSGFAHHSPNLYATPIPLLYLIGPSLHFYYERLLGNENSSLDLIHFIPISIGTLPLFYWYGLDIQTKEVWMNSVLQGQGSPYDWCLRIWVLGPKVSILVYSSLVLFRKSSAGTMALRYMPKNLQRFSLLLLIYIFMMIAVDITGYVVGLRSLFTYSAWSHTFAAVCVYLYSKANPSVLLEISDAFQKVRYSQSKLVGLDLALAQTQLHSLMIRDALYEREDLRLPSLAEKLKLSPHQLSELINVHYQMSFNQYLNVHRILVACELLLKRDKTILTIAYEVGFNSKSAFNRAFKLLMGSSPTEYKENSSAFSKEKAALAEKIEPKL